VTDAQAGTRSQPDTGVERANGTGAIAPLESLDDVLGVAFSDPAMREAALTHRSFAFERNLTVTNERLEFLGDSVLGLVVTDMAYLEHPSMPEGALAKLRAAIVNMSALAEVARSLRLGDLVLLGKGEEQSGGRDKSSILADALEAVFGAVYLDRGLEVATELIERLFRPRMQDYLDEKGPRDYKTILQELASQALGSMPEYRIGERGPDHEKEFTATVHLGGESMGTGIGRSKKEAEQRAAQEAFARISERLGSDA